MGRAEGRGKEGGERDRLIREEYQQNCVLIKSFALFLLFLYFFYCFISVIALFPLLLISFAGLRKEKTASVDSVGM
jgi:hypothetical protein